MSINPRFSCGAVAMLVGFFGFAFTVSAPANAQIKRPGSHIKYDVELEPHFVYQLWHKAASDEGMGLGFRASIPIVEDGPIKKINNSMAISFGIDWAHFDDSCNEFWWYSNRRVRPYYWNADCQSDQIWFPVVLQWNFWLTKTISVFGEPGLAFQHRRWDYYVPCNSPNGWCEADNSDTDLEMVFWGGARFLVSDSIAITLRLGDPSFNAGVSFFL